MEKGDNNARQILITRNLRLVQYIANKFSNTGIENEELVSVGTIGLIKGIETFKSTLNFKQLASYVSRCIQNEILSFLRKSRKYMSDISLEVTIKSDEYFESELKLKDIIEATYTDNEYELYENIQYISEVLDYILNGLESKQKICILYFVGGYKQKIIANKVDLTQSGVSRILISAKEDLKSLIAMERKLYKRKYTIEVYDRLYYKVSLEIEEIHTYDKISEVILSSLYHAIYKPNHIEIFINAESEAMELLAEITQIIEY